jgi:hypothetical protein
VWLKIVLALAAACVVVVVCFQWFFPWLSPRLPFNELTVEGDIPASTSPAAPAGDDGDGGESGGPSESGGPGGITELGPDEDLTTEEATADQ